MMLHKLSMFLVAVLAVGVSWLFWNSVVQNSTLPPWQVVAIPAAFFGFAVGGVAKRWTWGVAVLILGGSLATAVLGDWEEFRQVTSRAVEHASSVKVQQSTEAWILAKAAEHAQRHAADEKIKNGDAPGDPAPPKPSEAPREIRLATSAVGTLYWESLGSRLKELAATCSIAVVIAMQGAHMALRSGKG